MMSKSPSPFCANGCSEYQHVNGKDLCWCFANYEFGHEHPIEIKDHRDGWLPIFCPRLPPEDPEDLDNQVIFEQLLCDEFQMMVANEL